MNVPRNRRVAGRDYLDLQAATLLRFAKATTDPEVAASLRDKAADLKEQADERQGEAGGQAADAGGGYTLSDGLPAKEPR